MKIKFLSVFIISVLLSSLGFSQNTDSILQAARLHIEIGNNTWSKSIEEKDGALLATVFDMEGCLLVSGNNIIRGHIDIQNLMQSWLDGFETATCFIETLGTWLDGNIVFETGKYQYKLTDSEGTESNDTGKYLVMWKPQSDGSWKILRDIGIAD